MAEDRPPVVPGPGTAPPAAGPPEPAAVPPPRRSADGEGAGDAGHPELPRQYRRTRDAPGAGPPAGTTTPAGERGPAAPLLLDPSRLDEPDEPLTRPRRRWTRPRTVLAAVAGLVVLLLAAGLVGAQVLSRRVLDDVERIPNVFAPLEEATRPAKPAGTERTLNVLVVGVDTDGTGPEGRVRESADVIMLMHAAADRRSASFVFLPRDSWVPVPGRGPGRISSAYAAGGPSLLVRTVEQLTALRIDHFGVLDFAGFKDITDAMGGVDLRVPAGSGAAPAGERRLDGDAALRYLRERRSGPAGEMDRVRRQQDVMRAMMAKAGAQGLLSDPRRTLTLLDSVAEAVSVDDSLDDGRMRSLAFSLRSLRPGSVTFLTAPIRAADTQGGQGVVRLDAARARALWTAIGKDDVTGYARSHPEDVRGATPQ